MVRSRSKTFGPCIVLLLCSPIVLPAQDPGSEVIGALDAFLDGRIAQAQSIAGSLGELRDPFWAARLEIVNGLLSEAAGDPQSAEERYRRAEEIALTSPGLAETAEGYAVVSEAKSRLMIIKGIAYIIANASAAERYAQRALELDSGNVTALLVFAQGKVNAPRLFGGNVELGIELLESITKREVEDSQLFTAHYALAVAWRKKRDEGKALDAIDAALRVFPGSPEARALRDDLTNR